jgi:hypothetical protein
MINKKIKEERRITFDYIKNNCGSIKDINDLLKEVLE